MIDRQRRGNMRLKICLHFFYMYTMYYENSVRTVGEIKIEVKRARDAKKSGGGGVHACVRVRDAEL